MTHHIHHTYDEILPASSPGLEVHVEYNCESEIEIDDDGNEESNRLLSISARVGSRLLYLSLELKSPLESDGQQAREFLARLRENARQALWAKALEEAKKAGYIAADLNMAALRWMKTGKARLLEPLSKPEKPFVI